MQCLAPGVIIIDTLPELQKIQENYFQYRQQYLYLNVNFSLSVILFS
jgi:hypothetical protein